MKNGRCRMHGGATPSHTAAARARIAAARTKTGERTQEMRAHCENVAAFIRRNRIVVAMARLLILPIWETSLDLEQFAAYFSAQTPMRPENTESQARSSRHLSQQITDGGSRIESGAGDDVGVGNMAEARRAPRAFPHKPPCTLRQRTDGRRTAISLAVKTNRSRDRCRRLDYSTVRGAEARAPPTPPRPPTSPRNPRNPSPPGNSGKHSRTGHTQIGRAHV